MMKKTLLSLLMSLFAMFFFIPASLPDAAAYDEEIYEVVYDSDISDFAEEFSEFSEEMFPEEPDIDQYTGTKVIIPEGTEIYTTLGDDVDYLVTETDRTGIVRSSFTDESSELWFDLGDEFGGGYRFARALDLNPENDIITVYSEPSFDGAEAIITGKLPEGAIVKIETVSLSEADLIMYFGEEMVSAMTDSTAYNIKILADGNEWQPEETVTVTVKYAGIEPLFYDTFGVLNIYEVPNRSSYLETELNDDGSLSFETDNSGLFIFYIVDFSNEEPIDNIEEVTELTEELSSDELGSIEPSEEASEMTEELSLDELDSIEPVEEEPAMAMMAMMAAPLGAGPGDPHDMTPVPGHIRIKVNVFDWDTGDPLSNVRVGMNRRGTAPGTAPSPFMTAVSESDGAAYFDRTYTVGTREGKFVAYLDGIQDDGHIIYDERPAYSGINGVRFDIDSVSSGFNLDITVSGKIRNLVSGSYGGKISYIHPVTHAQYDDFIFHNGMLANGASIEFNMFVKAQNVTVSFENKYIKDWNPADYPAQTVRAGSTVIEPSRIPVNSRKPDTEFLGWADKSTGELFDFDEPVAQNYTLVPKWAPNPNAQGYIHLDSFLWDHDAYNGTYQTGQTNTTVNDLVYKVEYYDQAVSTTSVWNLLTTVTVDENGQADFVLTPEMLQEVSDFRDQIAVLGSDHVVAIDIGPDKTANGWHDETQRPFNYEWDWMKMFPGQDHGAGLIGVRMMWVNDDADQNYDLVRNNNHWARGKNGDTTTPTVGNVQYASNQNHVPWVTDGMLEDGFEIYWKCYVTPSMTVNFDLNGGIGTGDYREQKMPPINSLPDQHREDFLVKHPGGTVTKPNMIFAGWYKVNDDGTMETIPWDFANRIVTESMVLRAVFTDQLYEVKFVTPNNGTQTYEHQEGDTPAWSGENPTPPSAAGYTYTFKGWKETTGSHLNTEYVFHENYDFTHQSRPIYENGASIPVAVNNTFANLTVYTAQFEQAPINYTLSYDLNGGTGTFPAQTYTAISGVTTHNAEPIKTNYKFTGWGLKSTDGNWENRTYSKNETVTGKYGNTELLAHYSPLYSYKLNFDKNTDDTVTNMPENIPQTNWIEDSTKTMTWVEEPVCADRMFKGWATSASGPVVIPAGTKSYQMTGIPAALQVQTLYAVWDYNERPYKVKYLEQDTDTELHTEKNDTAQVGSTVTEVAETITGYDLVSVTPQSLVISSNEADNVIIFYYEEQEVTINYVAVPNYGGTLSLDSETVKVLNGNPAGSQASANTGFRFKGWYSDPECTNKLTDSASFTPVKDTVTGMFEAATYYAKFEAIKNCLTITKTGCSDLDENQSFIFHLTSVNDPALHRDPVDMYVTIQGNNSVTINDLAYGPYNVDEASGWSWRYTGSSNQVTITGDEVGCRELSVNNTRTNGNLLNGSAYAINTEDGRK